MVNRANLFLSHGQSLFRVSSNLRTWFKEDLSEIQYNALDWEEVACQYIALRLLEAQADTAGDARWSIKPAA